ncbi:DNA primase [Acidothermaceae bacterium B102]|nr:DNA primase [Acidothermaceae bacterium B102]
MAGRIRDEDVALVRERAAIAEIVGEHLALRRVGNRLSGLCPFHDERSPSFSVNEEQGFFYCFGCGENGDVISFVQKIDHLDFRDAIERLAARFGVVLRYEQGSAAPRQEHNQRARLVAANQAAAQFYAEQLTVSAEAAIGREELAKRGFDQKAAEQFGVGYAPKGWDVLVKHLRSQGFSAEELIASGLASEGQRGPIDRFRGRLIWPIADIGGDVIAFGARKLYDDDTMPGKYINTSETSLYKKSHVLYGLSTAKRDIARQRRAVIVEGYTDVMAAHLAGVTTAVATCGTAFGEDHIKVLRRLLMDQDEFRGEVIFTFDGDAAGQKAAMRAFEDDQKFVTQTFVAIEPGGMDPCDLRVAKGDAAVRDLVEHRIPLAEFAIRTVLSRYDLTIPDGRVQALSAAAPVVAKLKDRALRPEYARQLAGWLGMDVDTVLSRVAEVAGQPVHQNGRRQPAAPAPRESQDDRPDPHDRELFSEREVLKVALQRPVLAGPVFDGLEPEMFTSPAYRLVRGAIASAGGCATVTTATAWIQAVTSAAPNDFIKGLATELAVEPILIDREVDQRYVSMQLATLQERAVGRRLYEVKSRLQRMNPLEQADDYNKLAGELFALEQYRRALREQAIGAL